MTIFYQFFARAALAVVSLVICDAAQAFTLKEGVRVSIVKEKDAPESVSLAARELQEHLKLVLNVDAVIGGESSGDAGFLIYLGDTKFAREKGVEAAKMPSDGFRILSEENWMIIAGNDYSGPVMTGLNNPMRVNESYNDRLKISAFGSAGTLFGAYHFLERFCGVRWYMPGPLGRVTPRLSEVDIEKADVVRSPAFSHRHVYYCFFPQSDEDTLWYRRSGFGAPFPVQINHSFGMFLKYKDTNPEFFALIDGKRDFAKLSTIVGPGNLNLSNPDLVDQVIKDINAYFDLHPEQKIFPLCPNDGMLKISEDPISQAQIDESRGSRGKFSNYVWGFVNKVAQGVAQKHPDKLVGCIAYESYNRPPSNIEKLSPNVAVMICKTRGNFTDQKYQSYMEESIREWKEKASVIYNWEYYCDAYMNPGWRGYPIFFPKIVQKDTKFLRGISNGEFIEAESWTPDQYTDPKKIIMNFPGLQHPLLYVTARLLWEPDLDLDGLLAEYYRLFYGPAENDMRSFWELAEQSWMKKGQGNIPSAVYDRDVLQSMLDFLQKAKEKAGVDTVYGQRVALVEGEFKPALSRQSRLESIKDTSYDIFALKAEPTIDGELEASIWGRLPIAKMIDRHFQTASPMTHLRLGWDAQALYLAVTCFEPAMSSIVEKAAVTDKPDGEGLWQDDSLEIFLVPDQTKGALAHHLIINSSGVVWSGGHRDAVFANAEWDSKATVATRKESGKWTLEAKIPWSSLGVSPATSGRMILANFFRNRQAGGELEQSSWAPLLTGWYFQPGDFGRLTLTEKTLD